MTAAIGIEPMTCSLGSCRSNTELHPRRCRDTGAKAGRQYTRHIEAMAKVEGEAEQRKADNDARRAAQGLPPTSIGRPRKSDCTRKKAA